VLRTGSSNRREKARSSESSRILKEKAGELRTPSLLIEGWEGRGTKNPFGFVYTIGISEESPGCEKRRGERKKSLFLLPTFERDLESAKSTKGAREGLNGSPPQGGTNWAERRLV